MNKVELIGRLTRDPDVRVSEGEKSVCVARFTLAVNRRVRAGQEQTADFISCVTFGKTAEFVQKFLNKGVKIAVCGRIQTGSYTNKDGVKVYTTDVVAEDVEFCESKSSSDQKQETTASGGDNFMSIPDGIDEELPFS